MCKFKIKKYHLRIFSTFFLTFQITSHKQKSCFRIILGRDVEHHVSTNKNFSIWYI